MKILYLFIKEDQNRETEDLMFLYGDYSDLTLGDKIAEIKEEKFFDIGNEKLFWERVTNFAINENCIFVPNKDVYKYDFLVEIISSLTKGLYFRAFDKNGEVVKSLDLNT